MFTVFSILTMSIYTRHSLSSRRETHSAAILHWTRVTNSPHVATCLAGWLCDHCNKSQLTVVTSPCCCRAHTESHGVLEVAGSGPAPAAPGTSFTWALALAQPDQPSPAQPSPAQPSPGRSIAQPCPVLGHAAPLARASYSAPLPGLVRGGQVDMLLMSLAPILTQ